MIQFQSTEAPTDSVLQASPIGSTSRHPVNDSPDVAFALWANMTSSTKPEVYNSSQRRQTPEVRGRDIA